MVKRIVSGATSAAVLAIFALILAAPAPLQAERTATVGETRRTSWGSSTFASQDYIENWAYTTHYEQGVDSYVASWIQGEGTSNNTSGPGHQTITASVGPIWTSPWFCGWYTGFSNHWLIDGYDWIELEEHLQDSDYAGPCEF